MATHMLHIERPYSRGQDFTLSFTSEEEARAWIAQEWEKRPNPKNGTEDHERVTLLSVVDVLSDETF